MELYIHIPFCVRKCRYCDFVSFPDRTDRMEAYTEMVLAEARQRAAELPASLLSAETVYIGGGTPSLIPAGLFLRMIRELKRIFNFSRVREFTTEANPGTVTEDWAEAALQAGVSRISLGMQAAQPEILQTLGRIHTLQELEQSVSLLRRAGFVHLSLDLMFGIPGQSRSDWTETLEKAVSLEPEHISAYGLIPEDGTPLERDLREGRCALPEPEEERAMYEDAISLLSSNGYQQYEISNFARPGCACRHNIGYWTQVPYLGLGISAASMFPLHLLKDPSLPYSDAPGFPCVRQKNPDTFEAYRELLETGSAPERDAFRETEVISPEEARFETMMLGLRMNEGVSEKRFRQLHGVPLEEVYGRRLHELAWQGLIIRDAEGYRLTRKGMDLQNIVLVELM